MRVTIRLLSGLEHVSGVLTGFQMLEQCGELTLNVVDARKDPCETRDALLEADVDGKIVLFDTMDGYFYNCPDAVHRHFAEADVIFKRSFSAEKNQQFPEKLRRKLHPLGLNYYVTCSDSPLRNHSSLKNRLVRWAKDGHCSVQDFEAEMKTLPEKPKILFLTRLWDPNEQAVQGHPEFSRQWEEVNESRIELIRTLRKRFPQQFTGGLSDTPYARAHCPELVVPKYRTGKRFYLRRMKQTEICIASTGLHESIGWKLAEYVAAGRAIVSEPLRYEVPGGFASGEHYLEYTTPEECVAQVEALLADPVALQRMAQNNTAYYREWLRPDQQVRHVLEQLNEGGTHAEVTRRPTHWL